MLLSFPLLALPVIAYNLIVFFAPLPWSSELFSLGMVSGARWTFAFGDLIVVSALVLLFFEILKATRTGTISILDHVLSTILFIICLIEFILVAEAATSVYFLLTAITLIDVVAGYSVTITAARRDFGVERYPSGY